jgi:hypothetical protein
VDDLFVPNFPNFENFMYLNQDSFGSSIYPKTSCELNYTSKGFSCNFLDLTVSQSLQGLSYDIFDKRSQPEYAGIEMIRMPHVHSNISMTVKQGVINSQFYIFLKLCSCKTFFVFQMVTLIVFLKAKGYPFKVLLKRTRGLVLKEKFMFGISAFGIFCRNPTLAKCGGEAQHLEKLEVRSLPGLPNVQSSTASGKTPRIGVFLVSLERSRSLDV